MGLSDDDRMDAAFLAETFKMLAAEEDPQAARQFAELVKAGAAFPPDDDDDPAGPAPAVVQPGVVIGSAPVSGRPLATPVAAELYDPWPNMRVAPPAANTTTTADRQRIPLAAIGVAIAAAATLIIIGVSYRITDHGPAIRAAPTTSWQPQPESSRPTESASPAPSPSVVTEPSPAPAATRSAPAKSTPPKIQGSDAYVGLRRGNRSQPLGNTELALSNCSDATLLFGRGDFSGDGKTDIICKRPDNNLYLLKGNGASGFAAPVQIGQGWGNMDLIFSPGDFDSDGKNDLIYRRDDTTNLYLLRGDGAGGWAQQGYEIGRGWSVCAVIFSPGDFSGDGKPDVLCRRHDDLHLYMVRGNGTGGWIDGASIQVGAHWQACDTIFSPGDFDGDGKNDVMCRWADTHRITYTRGNGFGGWIDGVSIQIAPSAEGSLFFSPGDVSGDVKPDVLLKGQR